MKKNVIIMCYFVNAKYNKEKIFVDWLINVKKYYLVDTNRTFIIFTDNKNLLNFNNIYSNIIINFVKDDFFDVGENRLKKIFFLQQILLSINTNKIDYIAFFQSNLRLNTYVYIDELIENKKISAVLHPEFQKTLNFKQYYHQEFVANVTKSLVNIQHYDTSSFKYFQNGQFIIDILYAKYIISWMYNAIITDKFNNVKILGQPFDERYFNFFMNVIDNNKNVKILDANIYNNRNKEFSGCKIYQINKNTSNLFK